VSGISWNARDIAFRLGPAALRRSVLGPTASDRTFDADVRKGYVPEPAGYGPGHRRWWTIEDQETYRARRAAAGLGPIPPRVKRRFDEGRRKGHAIMSQRRDLRALVDRIPLGAGEVVRQAIGGALHRYGLSLEPERSRNAP
jgi:hypothetical protein